MWLPTFIAKFEHSPNGTSLAIGRPGIMTEPRGQSSLAQAIAGIAGIALAAIALAGCIVAREKDPCAGDACDPIPLPARDVDRTESTEDTSSTKAAPLGDGNGPTSSGGAGDGGTETGSPAKGSGQSCSDRTDCASLEFCCFFVISDKSQCAVESECRGGQTFFVCEEDSDCPGTMQCIAQTNTGHRACF